MNTGRIISDTDYAIKPTDSIKDVLNKMAEYRLAHLPVVKEELFLGLVADEALIEHAHDMDSIEHAGIPYIQVHVFYHQHIHDALFFFQIHHLDILPVLDDQHMYVGALTRQDLINALSRSMSVHEPGAIIELEMGNRDNALSHIAHIVESDNAQVLNSNVQTFTDSERLEVTIKINKSDISGILASLTRHDYIVKATYNDESNDDGSRDRFDQLMNYINM